MPGQEREISDDTKILARNLRTLLSQEGWSYADLAFKLQNAGYRIQPSDLGKYLRIGLQSPKSETKSKGYKDIPSALVSRCASVFKTPLDALYKSNHNPAHHPSNLCDPRYHDLGSYAEKLIEHEEHLRRNRQIKIFGPSVTLRAMHPEVRERYHLSQFGSIGSVKERFDKLGDDLRRHYFKFDPAKALEVINFVRFENLKRLIQCKAPFDRCRPSDVVSFFELLRTECAQNRRFRLRLLLDEKFDKHPDELTRIKSWDTIAVIGNTLATWRTNDFVVLWNEEDAVVSEWTDLLDQLEKLSVYPQLDQLLETAVNRLDAYEKGKPDMWEMPPSHLLWQPQC
jgi:hypothetical protein